MRGASVRVVLASMGAVLGFLLLPFVAVPEQRASFLSHLGIEVERPRRYLAQCAVGDDKCVEWYHDNLIPNAWDDLLLYGGLVAILLFAGYVGAKGETTRAARAALTGAIAGAIYWIILWSRFALTSPNLSGNELARAFLDFTAVWFIALATIVAYIGGRVARRVA